MPVRAYSYDADGTDREVTLDQTLAMDLSDRHLLWVDITAYAVLLLARRRGWL